MTNGPGSGNLIRTDDIPGMNRLLYQLSYAAMWSMQFRHRRNSFCIISDTPRFVKTFFAFFEKFSRGLRRRCRPRDWGVSINQTQPDVPQSPPAAFCKIVLPHRREAIDKAPEMGYSKDTKGAASRTAPPTSQRSNRDFGRVAVTSLCYSGEPEQ